MVLIGAALWRGMLSTTLLVACLALRAPAQSKECPALKERPPTPEEKTLADWSAQKNAMQADIEVGHAVAGGKDEIVAKGHFEVFDDGTVHYHLARPPRTEAAAKSATNAATEAAIEVDYYRRGEQIVVVAHDGGVTRIALADCRIAATAAGTVADPQKTPPRPPKLMVAVGGAEATVAERTDFVRWTVAILDPRHVLPPSREYDMTSSSGSSSPVTSTGVSIPVKIATGITDVVDVADASLELEWTAKEGVLGASLYLHSRGNKSTIDDDGYFDAWITFGNFAKSTATLPPQVEKALQPP